MSIVIFLNKINKKITIPHEKIKYPLTNEIKKFIDVNSIDMDIDELILVQESIKPFIIYTNTRWNSYNNHYIHESTSDNYYIIEPGHYYYIKKGIDIYSNEDNTNQIKNNIKCCKVD